MGKSQSKTNYVNEWTLEQDESQKLELGLINIDSHSSQSNIGWNEVIEIVGFIILCLVWIRYARKYCLTCSRRNNVRKTVMLASAITANSMSAPTIAVTQSSLPVLQTAMGPVPAIDYTTWRDIWTILVTLYRIQLFKQLSNCWVKENFLKVTIFKLPLNQKYLLIWTYVMQATFCIQIFKYMCYKMIN